MKTVTLTVTGITIAVWVAVVATSVFAADSAVRPVSRNNTVKSMVIETKCPDLILGIQWYQSRTWKYQMKLGRDLTNLSSKPYPSCKYAKWVAGVWRKRANIARSAWQERLSFEKRMHNPIEAIRYVFGRYADQAISVSRCETGGTFSVYASNGQYLGLFQMGSSERNLYGHGRTPLEQAHAAFRYFVASGRDWSPWQCQPGGSLQW